VTLPLAGQARDAWAPRLVALDLDGTVVGSDEQMSVPLLDAVAAARAAGTHVVLATGRSLHGVRDVAFALGLQSTWAVCSNGAVTAILPPDEHVVDVVTFDARPAVALLAEHVPGARYAVEVLGSGYRVTAPFPDGELEGDIILESLEELVAEPVNRVVVRSPAHTSAEFYDIVESVGLHGVAYAVGHTAWLDLAPQGVTKASALAQVCARLEVAQDDVLALGDGRNDVEMLAWAGHGVAMGQAVDEVRLVADEVTAPYDEDGAALVLARYFP
jgi:hydroxymethylpyrimidine pyrophosphatase-like HAD family hydrolase